MFETRLRVLMSLLVVAMLVVVARLGQLQLVQGDYYRQRAEASYWQRPTDLPFLRGRILDRAGVELAWDATGWDLRVDYSILALEERHIDRHTLAYLKTWRKERRYPGLDAPGEIEAALSDEARASRDARAVFLSDVQAMWRDLVRFVADTNLENELTSERDLRQRAEKIHRRVAAVRAVVARRRGFDADVAEEISAHAVVKGLDPSQQLYARERLSRYPWIHVDPSRQRSHIADPLPFAHVLGRIGRVQKEHLEDDPNAGEGGDRLARYQPNDLVGISGVERAAERLLRGRWGTLTRDRSGNVIPDEEIRARSGQDVTLTLSADLQRQLYDLLRRRIAEIPESSGGAVVVLDVPSREVLALVSYPSYDPIDFERRYEELRDDTERMPLRFRAVANRYAPGSIIKPLTCLTALMNGSITLSDRHYCAGRLYESNPNAWRCWAIHGTSNRMQHGSVNVVEALRGSCNVFVYYLGEKLGVDRITSAFDMFGIGKRSGTGLSEENSGINPTADYLMRTLGTPATSARAKFFAMGQSEVSVTPVQAANLMATYATGRYRPVTLIRGLKPAPEWILPADEIHVRAIKQGMYEVVNHPRGTAYEHARLEDENFVLCGKTGSATVQPWPTTYRIPYEDKNGIERVADIREGAKKPAIDRFAAEHPDATFDPLEVKKIGTWPRNAPPEGEAYSHAWFGGFLQPVGANGKPDWSQAAPIAFAVIIEFGGSGGRTTGPVAKSVARKVLDLLGPELTR